MKHPYMNRKVCWCAVLVCTLCSAAPVLAQSRQDDTRAVGAFVERGGRATPPGYANRSRR